MKFNLKISFPSALLILFIALKLCNVIAWPWLWVLSPLWLPLAIAVGLAGIVISLALVAAIVAAIIAFALYLWGR